MPRQHNAKSKQGHKYGTYAWYQDEHEKIPGRVYAQGVPKKKQVTAYQTYRDERGILRHSVDAEGDRIKSGTIRKHTYAQLGRPPTDDYARSIYDREADHPTPYGISRMSHAARVRLSQSAPGYLSQSELAPYAAKMEKNRQIGAKKAAKTKKAKKKAAVKAAKTPQKAIGVTTPVLVKTYGPRPMYGPQPLHKVTIMDADAPLPVVLRSAEMREFAPRAALPGPSARPAHKRRYTEGDAVARFQAAHKKLHAKKR